MQIEFRLDKSQTRLKIHFHHSISFWLLTNWIGHWNRLFSSEIKKNASSKKFQSRKKKNRTFWFFMHKIYLKVAFFHKVQFMGKNFKFQVQDRFFDFFLEYGRFEKQNRTFWKKPPLATDYGHTKAKTLILCSPNSKSNPK